MTFSTPVLGTTTKKVKLNWWEYWVSHCWMTGWQSIRGAFRIWSDLMTDNFTDYALPRTVEDPFEECRDWFWVSLGEDNVYPKEFLEYLQQMANDIDLGKVKTYSMDELMSDMKDIFDDLDVEDM
jgi:hypothetical protein